MEAIAEAPEGYMMNAQGHLVPEGTVKEIDKLRDQLVRKLVKDAKEQAAALACYKADAMDEVSAFVDLSAGQYGAKIGGDKGNVTLMSYDGRYKIQRAMGDTLSFDERLQAAKALIDECFTRWTEGSKDEIKAIVNHAFQVNREGKVSISRIMGLRQMNFQDPQWLEAMQAIADSIHVVSSKAYIRAYERIGTTDQWRPIALDVAKV